MIGISRRKIRPTDNSVHATHGIHHAGGGEADIKVRTIKDTDEAPKEEAGQPSQERPNELRKHGEASPKRQKLGKEKYVLWFSEVGKNDAGVVGGKGSNLGECAQAGLDVPPGFCITANAFRLHMAACGIDFGSSDGQTNKDIATRILQQEMASPTSKGNYQSIQKAGITHGSCQIICYCRRLR